MWASKCHKQIYEWNPEEEEVAWWKCEVIELISRRGFDCYRYSGQKTLVTKEYSALDKSDLQKQYLTSPEQNNFIKTVTRGCHIL